MGMGRVKRIARVARVSDLDASNSILTITDGTIVALVTTKAPHGLSNGQTVRISGSSTTGYNLPGTVSSVTATTFKADAVEYTSDAVGGRWELV